MAENKTYNKSSSYNQAVDDKGLRALAGPSPGLGAWDSMTTHLPDAVNVPYLSVREMEYLPSVLVSGLKSKHFAFLSAEILEGTDLIGGIRSSLRISLCNSFRHVAIFLLSTTHAAARFTSFLKNARSKIFIARLVGGRNISVEFSFRSN